MNRERIAKMAENIASELTAEEIDNQPAEVSQSDDAALELVDQAVDTMIASVQVIEENLPKIKADNVPEKAAVDAVQDLVDTAVKPYLSDIAKAMQVFGG